MFPKNFAKITFKKRLLRVYLQFLQFLGKLQFSFILKGTSLSQILQRLDKYQFLYQELIVFTLCTNTESIQSLPHQFGKNSIKLVVQGGKDIYDGKELKNNKIVDSFGKNSKKI